MIDCQKTILCIKVNDKSEFNNVISVSEKYSFKKWLYFNIVDNYYDFITDRNSYFFSDIELYIYFYTKTKKLNYWYYIRNDKKIKILNSIKELKTELKRRYEKVNYKPRTLIYE